MCKTENNKQQDFSKSIFIGATIKRLRKEQKLTQTKLAELTFLSKSEISKIENGTKHSLSFLRASMILKVLGSELVCEIVPTVETVTEA